MFSPRMLKLALTRRIVLCLCAVPGLALLTAAVINSLLGVATYTVHTELSSLPTNEEARYLLYGDKPQSVQRNFTMYDPFLLRHIRAHVSRPTPGKRPRAPRPEEILSGDYNGVERLPGDISMCCQSTIVDKLLNGRRNGFYVECGALDGVSQSNTWFFETQRNWSGLLVEANPQLQRSVINVNRNALVLRACIGTVQQPMPARMRLAIGVSHLIKGGNYPPGAPGTADVICFPLNAVFAALGIKHVDFMSLDVEGPELEILSTVDWTHLRIDVIMLEYGGNINKLQALQRYFNATGLYKEAANLKSREGSGLDVVFQRLDIETN